MERVTLVGADDVARAGYAISGAGDQMQRAANTIDEAMTRHAARLEDFDLRAAQRAEERPALRDVLAMHASEFDVRNALEDLGRVSNVAGFNKSMSGMERNAIARYAFADAMLKARSA